MTALSAKVDSSDMASVRETADPTFWVDPALIDVPPGHRKLHNDWVETLAGSMRGQRQMTPIEIVENGDRFLLSFGQHRKAAAAMNGEPVLALIKTKEQALSAAERTLRRVEENFVRRDQTVLDRAVDVADWRAVYQSARGVIKKGRPKKCQVDTISEVLDPRLGDTVLEELSGQFAASFTEAAQRALNLSQKGVFRALKIASIAPDLRSAIALHDIADNQSELLLLADQEPEQQKAIVALLTSGRAAKVDEAAAIIEGRPAPRALLPYERFSNSFSRLSAGEQHQFFELHRAAIERWIARKR